MFFVFLLMFSFLLCEKQFADGVVATVGSRVVLFSDVLEETNLLAQQQQINPSSNPYLFDRLFDSVLNQQINKKAILSFVDIDSSLVVSYEEISSALNQRIDFYIGQLGSKEAFEDQVKMSVSDMKIKNWNAVRDEILIDKFKYSKFQDISITRDEVLFFYDTYKDSLPVSLEKSTFSVLQKKITPSAFSFDSFLFSLNSLRDSLVLGLLDFSVVASQRSLDPSASKNKGLMETSRGDLVPEYEKAAYGLKKGEVSGVVETSYGHHIIKLVDRVGEKITTQHVLFAIKPTKQDVDFTVSVLDSLKDVLSNDPGVFDSLAVLNAGLPSLSGVYSSFDFSKMPSFIDSFLKEGDVFSFSPVFIDGNVCYLVYKYDYFPPKKTTPDNDWVVVEGFALNKKRFDLFEKWINKEKEKLYIKVNDF